MSSHRSSTGIYRLSTDGMPSWGLTYLNDQDRLNSYTEDRMIEGDLMTKDFYTIHGCLLNDTINSADAGDPETHMGNIFCGLTPPNTLAWERQSQKDAAYMRQMMFPWSVSKAIADDPTMDSLFGIVYDDSTKKLLKPGTPFGPAPAPKKPMGRSIVTPMRMTARPMFDEENPSVVAMRRDYEHYYGSDPSRAPMVSSRAAPEVLVASAPRFNSYQKHMRAQLGPREAYSRV